MRNATTHSATRVCSGCGTEKPLADFRPRRAGRRLSPRCWVCRYAAARTARARRAALPPGPFDGWPKADPAGPRLTRVCCRCGLEKPLAELRLVRASGRRTSPCKACHRADRRRYYAANPEKERAACRRYAQREDPAKRRARYARQARRQRDKQAVRERTRRLRVLGLLTLADHCEDCGGQAQLVHHETYGDVCALVSLCRRCHLARHFRVWRKTGGGPVRYPHEYEQEETQNGVR